MARDVAYQVLIGTDRTRQALRGGSEQEADRARFEKIAADYQNEIDATAAPPGDQEPSAQTETASSDARASPGESAPSNAIASESENAPASTDSPQENKVLSLSGPSPGQSTGDRMD